MQDFFEKIGFWGRLGVVFAGSVIVSIVLAWFLYPKYPDTKEKIAGKQQELADLKNQITQAQAVKEKLAEFKEEIKRLEERLDTFLDILPTKKDTDSLIRKMHNIAEETNVDIVKYGGGKLKKQQMFTEYSLNLDLVGGYHSLAMFFDKLRTIERIIYITNLNMQTNKSAESTIKASCQAKTFIMQAPKEGE